MKTVLYKYIKVIVCKLTPTITNSNKLPSMSTISFTPPTPIYLQCTVQTNNNKTNTNYPNNQLQQKKSHKFVRNSIFSGEQCNASTWFPKILTYQTITPCQPNLYLLFLVIHIRLEVHLPR